MTNAELLAKIKAEIERLKGQLIRGACAAQIEMETNCKEAAYNEVLSFLSTIESEKPMNQEGLNVTDFCKPIDPGIAQCIADHSWEMLGEDERPVPSDLEEAANEYAYRGMPDEMKPYVKPVGDEVIKNFIAGAKWQKQEMLKEAVKCTVTTNLANRPVIYFDQLKGFQYGDNVRIIIVKE